MLKDRRTGEWTDGKPDAYSTSATKFQTSFVVCFVFFFNKLSIGKKVIYKADKLNVIMNRLIWIYVICKSLLLSPTAVKE